MLSFPGTGHLHPLTALGRQLARRGHQVTVFQVADAEPVIRAAGLGFWPIGSADFPLGSLRVKDQRLGRLQGMKALGFIFERFCRHSAVVLRDAPRAMWAAGIDALIVDQAEFAGGTVAERLGLPFATVILTLPLNLDPEVPFCGFHAYLESSVGARLRTAAGNARVRALASGLCGLVNRQRQAWGLRPKANLDDFHSDLAQVAQVPAGFDFPQRRLPAQWRYTGPFLDAGGRRSVAFPWERLDASRPLIFVSMGTLQNGVKCIFRAVAEACAAFPVQTVLSLGVRPPTGGPGRGALRAATGIAPQSRPHCIPWGLKHGAGITVLRCAHGCHPGHDGPTRRRCPDRLDRHRENNSGRSIDGQALGRGNR